MLRILAHPLAAVMGQSLRDPLATKKPTSMTA